MVAATLDVVRERDGHIPWIADDEERPHALQQRRVRGIERQVRDGDLSGPQRAQDAVEPLRPDVLGVQRPTELPVQARMEADRALDQMGAGLGEGDDEDARNAGASDAPGQLARGQAEALSGPGCLASMEGAFVHLERSPRGFPPAEQLRPLQAGGGQPVVLAHRLPERVRQPLSLGVQRRVAADLAQRRLRAATTGVPHAIASSTGRPNPS